MVRTRRKVLLALATGGLVLAGAVAAHARPRLTGEAELTHILDGRVAGKPVDCIYMPSVSSSVVVDKTAIVYTSGHTLYVQRPNVGADQLSEDDVLVTRMTSSELCRIDTIQLHDRSTGFWRGFVGLNQFVPYTRPAKVTPAT